MTDRSTRRPSPRTWAAVARALALVGLIAVVIAVNGQQSAPRPATGAEQTEQATPGRATSSEASPAAEDSVAGPGSEGPVGDTTEQVAEPMTVAIPSIGVTSELLDLGLNDDGTVEVPPLEADDRAGWYERGPAPGAVGPAVLLGHVDSAEHGPGIFFDLGALAAGDEIEVSRADGTVAVFAVDRVEVHAKDDFPTLDVHGNTDDAQLRLITCGGAFDPGARSYEDNVIAFATLVDTRPA